MNVLELFAGAGGGIYGGLLLGHTPVCAVEIVEKNRQLLLQRQRDGIMPRFPIWDDVRTFDGNPWRGVVDIVSGGFPCTDISAAGKGAGIDGENSGLWREMARIVREVQPKYVFVENSPMLVTRGLGRVLSDLASLGYDCRWTCLSASDCGAPHKRDRIWILADSGGGRLRGQGEREDQQPWRTKTVRTGQDVADSDFRKSGERFEPAMLRGSESEAEQTWLGGRREDANTERERLEGIEQGRPASQTTDRSGHGRDSGWWPAEPGVCRVVDELADWRNKYGGTK